MKIRNIDKNQDWMFGSGVQSYVSNAQAIALAIKTRLRSWEGDCFFDLDAGVDWENYIGQKYSTQAMRNKIQEIVLGTSGVESIQSLDMSVSKNRIYTIRMSVHTVYGVQEIEVAQNA